MDTFHLDRDSPNIYQGEKCFEQMSQRIYIYIFFFRKSYGLLNRRFNINPSFPLVPGPDLRGLTGAPGPPQNKNKIHRFHCDI
jgi:hypothetical protein